MPYLWIAIGSAAGGVLRFWMSGWIGGRYGESFPWGTLVVNVLGSFLIGLVNGFAQPEGRIFIPSAGRQFLMIGILGGFTTFSSFSLQTLNLARDGEWLYAGGNIAGSVVICLVAVWLGHLCSQAILNVR